jgi:ABC-2 type transport system ATP-binding protein
LDEATAGVDPVSRREFWDLIYSLASEGVSVLATTHYMDEAEYCNTIGMMYQGKMVALASPETLKNDLPGTLVQIECSRPGEAVMLLQDHPGVLGASIHGALVHLTLEKEGLEPKVKKELAGAGIKINTWEVIQPSLEDVFLSMVSEQLSVNPFQDQQD